MLRKIRQMKVKYTEGEYANPLDETIRSPEQLYDVFKGMEDETQEKYIAVYLDGESRIMTYSLISMGNNRMLMSSPYDVMKKAILIGSFNIIILHNHPEGTAKPNKYDKASMDYVKQGAVSLKMKFIDYIVIGNGTFWSMWKNKQGDADYVVLNEGGLKWYDK